MIETFQDKRPLSAETLGSMANAVRALSVDMVEAANSGHPGMPLGAADLVTVLFAEFLKHNPESPEWRERDRFVLSAGHASAMLYAVLHLCGYPLSLDELRAFRQLHSVTSGHPEYHPSKGIECTTGPLGQGIGMGVGMAIAEAMTGSNSGEAERHHTWILAGDGCLMEGISHEACSLAGRLALDRLTLIYDANNNTIDGPSSVACTDDQRKRFESYGWATTEIDGHDYSAIREAYAWAQGEERPTFILARTEIGKYSALADSHKAHGTVLGEERARATRAALGMGGAAFELPEQVRAAWKDAGRRWVPEKGGVSAKATAAAKATVATKEVDSSLLSEAIDEYKRSCDARSAVASRVASGEVLEAIAPKLPQLVGGSADLTGPTCTATTVSSRFSGGAGNFVFYGIREHAMGAIMNGIALHGSLIPYGGTFLAFADYMKPAIRLAALMAQQVIFVMTHDTIGLGEDGPTHQPVEQMTTYRALPNLLVLRPADRMEVAEAWEVALSNPTRPSMLLLARQEVEPVSTSYRSENRVQRGGYLVHRAEAPAEITLVASGTEVAPAVEAAKKLEDRGYPCDVVSLPCLELFLEQSESYRSEVLRSDRLLVVEPASTPGWDALGLGGIQFHSMSRFGASGKKDDLLEHFGYTPEGIIAAAERRGLLERSLA